MEENPTTSTDSATRLKRDTSKTMTDKNSTELHMHPGMPLPNSMESLLIP